MVSLGYVTLRYVTGILALRAVAFTLPNVETRSWSETHTEHNQPTDSTEQSPSWDANSHLATQVYRLRTGRSDDRGSIPSGIVNFSLRHLSNGYQWLFPWG